MQTLFEIIIPAINYYKKITAKLLEYYDLVMLEFLIDTAE
jgi:hypothetical protein